MIKIVLIAFVCAALVLYLKSVNSELALLATIGAGIIILFVSVSYLSSVFDFINNLVSLSKIKPEYYNIIFKITAIGYLAEFSADTLQDFGLKSISDKLVFVGKIIIFCMSMPIIYAVFNLLLGIIQ